MKAMVIIETDKVGTCANAIAAICNKYQNIESITTLYINLKAREKVSPQILREYLVNLCKDYTFYDKAADVAKNYDILEHLSDLKNKIHGFDIIDIAGVNKDLAFKIAGISLNNKAMKVCQIHWKEGAGANNNWILTLDNHQYNDLLDSSDLALIRKNYFNFNNIKCLLERNRL